MNIVETFGTMQPEDHKPIRRCPTSSVHEMKTLIQSFHPLVVVETVEEERVEGLLSAAAAELNLPFFDWSAARGLKRAGSEQPIYGTEEPAQLLKHLAAAKLDSVFLAKDLVRHLNDPTLIRQCREILQTFSTRKSTLVLTGQEMELPRELGHKAVFFPLRLPGQEELKDVVRNVMRSLTAVRRVPVELDPEGLEQLLRALSGLTLNQARQVVTYSVLDNGRLDGNDVGTVLKRKADLIRDGGLLEYFPAEDNPAELGGFDRLKQWLDRAQVGFSPQARSMNLSPPKGILLVGVQGCGKSLAARVIARRWRLPLLKLEAGRLYDKYIGESERNFRRAVALAESMAPVVLWIDELEKGFSSAGSGNGDGGLSRRLFGALLTWLQEKKEEVFVAATGNDLTSLPPELLRKGRFDEIFFVDLPDAREREEIFRIHLEIRSQRVEDHRLSRLAEATDGYSGAEIEQVVVAGLYRALHESRPLTTEILMDEVQDMVPLSVARREDIERLRTASRGRFLPVR